MPVRPIIRLGKLDARLYSELQIRKGIQDNSKIIFLISQQAPVKAAHKEPPHLDLHCLPSRL